ncbi:zinc-ribbon domain-containing protein [Streptomyces sp. NPDC005568]
MASYCPHCGAPAPEEARFCMKCGRAHGHGGRHARQCLVSF